MNLSTTTDRDWLRKKANHQEHRRKKGRDDQAIAICSIPTHWNSSFRFLMELMCLDSSLPQIVYPSHILKKNFDYDGKAPLVHLTQGILNFPEFICTYYEDQIFLAANELAAGLRNQRGITDRYSDIKEQNLRLLALIEGAL